MGATHATRLRRLRIWRTRPLPPPLSWSIKVVGLVRNRPPPPPATEAAPARPVSPNHNLQVRSDSVSCRHWRVHGVPTAGLAAVGHFHCVSSTETGPPQPLRGGHLTPGLGPEAPLGPRPPPPLGPERAASAHPPPARTGSRTPPPLGIYITVDGGGPDPPATGRHAASEGEQGRDLPPPATRS